MIGFILAPGEAMPEIEEEAPPPAAAVAVSEVEKPSAPPPPAPPEETPRAVRSSPAARRLARELGVDITRGQGSGAVDLINVTAVAMLSEATVGELMRFIPMHPSIASPMEDAALDAEKRSLHLPKW